MAGAVAAGRIAGEIALYTVDGEVVSLTTPSISRTAGRWNLQRGARGRLPRQA